MKKVYILICSILMILLVGCNNEPVSTGGPNEFDKMKSELQLIPQEYNTNNAVKDGYFVISDEEVKSKIEIIDNFVSNSQNQKSTFITIIQYSTKYSTNRTPVITKILYNGIKYYAISDGTRVTNSNTDYHEFEFKYLKVFEEDNHKKYILLNDKKINYDQYMKSLSSSHSNDWIDAKFLCSYKN